MLRNSKGRAYDNARYLKSQRSDCLSRLENFILFSLYKINSLKNGMERFLLHPYKNEENIYNIYLISKQSLTYPI